MGMVQEYSKKKEIPLEDLQLKILFQQDSTKEDPIFDGLYLEGAFWNSTTCQISELPATTDFKTAISLPPFGVVITAKNDGQSDQFYCPLYVTPARKGDLAASGRNPNLIGLFAMDTEKQFSISHWIKRGVAMSTQLVDNDDARSN